MKVKEEEFSYKAEEDYIHFTFKGKWVFKTAVAWWKKVSIISKKLNFDKIFIEAIIYGEISLAQTYDLVSEIEQLGFKEKKIVYLNENPDHRTIVLFALKIAKASKIQAEVFMEKERAIECLNSKQ